jgi:hypothetical protein
MAQDAARVAIMQDKEMLFQVDDAKVVKNSKCSNYVNDFWLQTTEDDVHFQLSYEGGAGVCLHFSPCDCHYNIKLKFTLILFEPTIFQVCGEPTSLAVNFIRSSFG